MPHSAADLRSPQPRTALPAGLQTLKIEENALHTLRQALATDPLSIAFEQAAALMVATPGRVIVSGMGKSGLVGRRIASTLASTGTPAFFIHPAEAGHGDLGMITASDVVLALSWSGDTAELSDVIFYCRRFGVKLIAMTSRVDSVLARNADLVLTLPLVEEACPNRLAPTSSTAVQSALGDALAVSLITLRGFSLEDFRVFHPRGKIGAQLLRVCDVMTTDSALPLVDDDVTILAAMKEMSAKHMGVTGVVDSEGYLVGAFSDGDLRRTLIEAKVDAPLRSYMTTRPIMIARDRPISEALALMNKREVMQLFVCDGRRPVGILHMHDVVRAGVV